MRTTLTGLAVVLAALDFAVAGQQPPRDTRSIDASARTAVIHGRVTDDGGRPIARAIVTVAGVQPGGARTAITDDDGRFSIDSLPPGRYPVGASRPEFVATQYGQDSPDGPGVLVVVSDRDRVEANVVLPRGSSISGSLIDAAGDPVAHSGVTVARWTGDGHQRTPRYVRGAATDGRGAFRIWGLSAGEYVVYASRMAQHGGVPAGGAAVMLTSGEERVGVNVLLALEAPPARVDGTALGPDGQPIRGTRVQLVESTTGAIIRDPVMSPDGSFLFRSVPPGRYTLVAQASIHGNPSPAGNQWTNFWGMSDLAVDGAAPAVVSISMARGAQLTGRIVTTATGSAPNPSRMRLSVAPLDLPEMLIAGSLSGNTQPDGTFSIGGIPPGRYTLRISAPSMFAGWTLQSAMVGGVDAIDFPIQIDRDDVSGMVVTVSDRQTMLLGRIRRDGVAANSPSSVVVYSSDPRKWLATSRRWVQVVRPDTRGEFDVRGLPAGEYHVAIVERIPGDAWDDPAFLEALTPEATLTLAEGEPVTRELTLRARTPR
jgi:large repetitive protein